MPQTKINHVLRVTDPGHWHESQMPRPCEFQNLTGCCDMTQETRTAQCRNKQERETEHLPKMLGSKSACLSIFCLFISL